MWFSGVSMLSLRPRTPISWPWRKQQQEHHLNLFLLLMSGRRFASTHRVEVVPASHRDVTVHTQHALPTKIWSWVMLKVMSGCLEVRGHTLSRAAVIRRAGPHRNCLWMLQVFLSSTNLKQHTFPVRTEEPQSPHDSRWVPPQRPFLQGSSVSKATAVLLHEDLRPRRVLTRAAGV